MKKFITLIIAIAMIATLATGCGVDTPAEDVFNKYDKDTTITETEKDSADKSDDKDDDKSDSDKKDESDKKDDNKSESDKKDDNKVADNKPADNADKNNGSKPSGSGSTNSNTGSKPSGGNSNSGNTGTKPSGGNSNSGSKPSGGNTNQSKPVEQPKPSHSHSYAVVSQTGATCTAAGVTTYKCSCGHSYTEQNGGALGHAWQTQYNEWDEVVHHPGTIVTKLVCHHGLVFSNENEWEAHCDPLMEQGLDGCGISSYTEEVGGWDENVHHSDPCGQKCTRCGANG